MLVLFMNTIFLLFALTNHTDQHQKELGFLGIFIISILLALNLLLLLNPIARSDEESLSSEMYSRSLCTS